MQRSLRSGRQSPLCHTILSHLGLVGSLGFCISGASPVVCVGTQKVDPELPITSSTYSKGSKPRQVSCFSVHAVALQALLQCHCELQKSRSAYFQHSYVQ